MSEDYPRISQGHLDRRIRAVAMLNVGFSAAMMWLWSDIPHSLADPVRWATWAPLRPHPGLLEFPFVLLWGLPMAGTALAWLLRQGGSKRLALWVVSFPLLYLGILLACFHVVPQLMS